MRLATDADGHIEAFDNTKLVAVNTCPTWGIIRYGHHKTLVGERSTALDTGTVCHDVFAAVRLLDMYENQGRDIELFERQGTRLFGKDRFEEILLAYKATECEDERSRLHTFGLETLYTAGYIEDPMDKRRTMANIEAACMRYMDQWEWGKNPIWIGSNNVGIELPFNIVLTFTSDDGEAFTRRFIGKIDGMQLRKGRLTLQENKTASRLGNAWADSFLMAHQVTGYMIAGVLITGEEVERADVHGLCIPLPKSYDGGGCIREHVVRTNESFAHWFNWFRHTVDIYDTHFDDPIHAPRYTHSCNRYFRPCSMIPYCASPDDEKQEIFDEMRHDEWSPLHEVKTNE
jgi:hypothetical protein